MHINIIDRKKREKRITQKYVTNIGYNVCRQRALARSHVLFVGFVLIIHIVNIHARVLLNAARTLYHTVKYSHSLGFFEFNIGL